jgi:hypothetical protein
MDCQPISHHILSTVSHLFLPSTKCTRITTIHNGKTSKVSCHHLDLSVTITNLYCIPEWSLKEMHISDSRHSQRILHSFSQRQGTVTLALHFLKSNPYFHIREHKSVVVKILSPTLHNKLWCDTSKSITSIKVGETGKVKDLSALLHMLLSDHQNGGQNHDWTAVTSQHFIQEEIKSRLNSDFCPKM